MSRYIPKPRTALVPGTRVVILEAGWPRIGGQDPATVVADNGAGPVQVRWTRPRIGGQLGLVDRRRIRLVARPAATEVPDGQ